MPDPEKSRPPRKRVRRMAREPQPAQDRAEGQPSSPPRITKTQIVMDLLQRAEGSSLDELIAATGWQPHTTRAVLTSLRKKGHPLTSWKPETGARIYRIVVTEGGE